MNRAQLRTLCWRGVFTERCLLRGPGVATGDDNLGRPWRSVPAGSSSDEEGGDTSMGSSCSSLSAPCPAPNPKPKTIPTVSNPNSVYQVTNQFSEFALVPPPPAWAAYSNRKAFPGEGYPHGPPSGGLFAQQHSSQFQPPKGFKPYRATSSFTGPRQDKYHWVSKNRS
nr:maternal B9.10 protein-like isoform X3 [Salvelinus alpinus]